MLYTRSATSGPAVGDGDILLRTLSGRSRVSEGARERMIFDTSIDPESGEAKMPEASWSMAKEVEKWTELQQESHLEIGKLGVTFKNLSVYGAGEGQKVHENAVSQFNAPQHIAESRRSRHSPNRKTILDNVHGCVRPGEMLLVLGRPGAGCTTLLNILANRRSGYEKVEGDVHFGSMDHKQSQQYRGQIVMNSEEEIFFPTLTVGQTMDFATRMKVPAQRPAPYKNPFDYQNSAKDFLLRSMGIAHTGGTKVGDAFVRGVSGGERKRVSILEVLATQGSVFCWDNSTRGLDASSALEWARAMRAMTDIMGLTTIATLYQAGNGIYNLFDKVLVLDEGKETFYGTRQEARSFMEAQGFICDDAANVGDFLTGTTIPTERVIRSGCEGTAPLTAPELRDVYQKSDIRIRMEAEYDFPNYDETKADTAMFQTAVAEAKAKGLSKKSPFTAPFPVQLVTCITRQYQIIWGDKITFLIKQISTIVQALIVGSLFYNAPNNSAGLFVKGGALFFALLFNSLVAMSETTDSFTGRPIMAKHKQLALYHPAAFCIAQITADIPTLIFQVTTFSVVLYFMVGLKDTATAFFTFWIFLYTTCMVMTAFFRLCGAAFPSFDAASKVSGFAVTAVATYTGYMIPKPSMHPWFVWIYWINPLSYGFESLMANEFHNQIIPCVGGNLIPLGPSYIDNNFAACAGVRGARQGATSLTGDEYLRALSYSNSHKWRNMGVLWAWWALFVGLTIYFTVNWKQQSSGGASLVPREKLKIPQKRPHDEESQESLPDKQAASTSQASTVGDRGAAPQLVRNTSVFTWKNLCYSVDTTAGPRQLLHEVAGWVKPGTLGALMGSSGAGKTTLMDVLAQRKTEGTIAGSVLVDGRPLPVSFQRSAGYCEQLDVHEPFATVREALEFSALLRQSRDTPNGEILRYVDTVIDLLELHDLEHSLIGRVGAGLSVEQRKRVTIGVELVAKPSILIFLDEPTSGLDGQAAFNTLRFLRKLADAGQAVLCTIHQPSAQLFAQFDTLLLLSKGGRTVYFGDIGDNSATIKEYFKRNGAPCPSRANPAEHMIDVVSGSLSKGRDWHQIWLDSPECAAVNKELDFLTAEAASRPPGTTDDGHEFATTYWNQTKLVTSRMNVSLYRNTEYIMNKVALHVGSALFNGFTFWMIGNSVTDLQNVLFAVFNFIFVAPGVIAQLQPLFIERRDIFETREKKSKMYHWAPFVTGLILSEIPYLIVCAVLYYVCWYYTAGLPGNSNRAGAVFFVMLMYELMYTGIGQFVAAYAPNAVFASLINPLLIGIMISFCGVLVPYAQLNIFWRYWIYYLDPFTYLMGSMLVFTAWGREVKCRESELAVFDTPNGQTCSSYLAEYLAGAGSRTNLLNPGATTGCQVCQYRDGSDYLYSLNLQNYGDGWRDAGICALFVISSYGLVYVLMKLRTKAAKQAQ